jgi:hypothetical protein
VANAPGHGGQRPQQRHLNVTVVGGGALIRNEEDDEDTWAPR